MSEPMDWRKCKGPACKRRVGGGASWCCWACHPVGRERITVHTTGYEEKAALRGPWDPLRDSPF